MIGQYNISSFQQSFCLWFDQCALGRMSNACSVLHIMCHVILAQVISRAREVSVLLGDVQTYFFKSCQEMTHYSYIWLQVGAKRRAFYNLYESRDHYMVPEIGGYHLLLVWRTLSFCCVGCWFFTVVASLFHFSMGPRDYGTIATKTPKKFYMCSSRISRKGMCSFRSPLLAWLEKMLEPARNNGLYITMHALRKMLSFW